MNPNLLRRLLSGLTVSVAALVVATPSHAAAADCAAPKGVAEQRACKAAAEGVESLRRFSERTRNIYQIYVHDYSNAISTTATAKEVDQTKVAATRK